MGRSEIRVVCVNLAQRLQNVCAEDIKIARRSNLLHDPLQLGFDFPLLWIGGRLGECFGRRAQTPQADAQLM